MTMNESALFRLGWPRVNGCYSLNGRGALVSAKSPSRRGRQAIGGALAVVIALMAASVAPARAADRPTTSAGLTAGSERVAAAEVPTVAIRIHALGRARTAITFTLRCDLPCTVSGRARLRGDGGLLSFPFRTSIASPAAEKRVRVPIGPRARARLARWLYAGQYVSQSVRAMATDSSGNDPFEVSAFIQVEPPVSVDRPRAPRCERASGKTVFKQGDVRIYTTSTNVGPEGQEHFWWACRNRQTRRYLVAGGYRGTWFRKAILRADRLLLVDVGDVTTDGNESDLVLYDLRAVTRRYIVDFGVYEVETMLLAPNGAAAAIVTDAIYASVWGISPQGRATHLAASRPLDEPPMRIGSLRLENDTVFWTENDVEQSARIPS